MKELVYNFLYDIGEFEKQFSRVLDRTPNERAPSKKEFWVEFFCSIGLTIQNSQVGKDLNIQNVCLSVGKSGKSTILKLAFKVNSKCILRAISISDNINAPKNAKYSKNEINRIENYFFKEDARKTPETTINREENNVILHLTTSIKLVKVDQQPIGGQGSSGIGAGNIQQITPLELGKIVKNQKEQDKTLDDILDQISNPKTVNNENVKEFFSKLVDLYNKNPVQLENSKLEAKSHGFTYGVFTLMYKNKYALDIYVEQSAGKGFLDLSVIFRKMLLHTQSAPSIIYTNSGSRIIAEFKTGVTSVEEAMEQIQNEGYNYNLYDRSQSEKIISVGLNFEKTTDEERIAVNLDLRAEKTTDFIAELLNPSEAITTGRINKLLKNTYYSIRSEEQLELVLLGNIVEKQYITNKKVFVVSQDVLNQIDTKVTIFSFKYVNQNYILTITDTSSQINKFYTLEQEKQEQVGKRRSQIKTNSRSIEPQALQTTIQSELEKVVQQIQKQKNIHDGQRIDIVVNSSKAPQGQNIVDKRFEHLDKPKAYLQDYSIKSTRS